MWVPSKVPSMVLMMETHLVEMMVPQLELQLEWRKEHWWALEKDVHLVNKWE
jgi:hypothetical protein